MGTKNFTEKYFRDEDGWVKISAKGKKFNMTAEQLLNHLLPAIADIKPGLTWNVEYKYKKEIKSPKNKGYFTELLLKAKKI